uniref:Uncharacterized protein n=1 Tax=Fagus sylvatica TaxID=28930 RepID=A0A2N9H7V5_FAGSY
MATNEADWPVVLSKELPEGLSSSGRENEEMSSEVTTSTRVLSRPSKVYKHWSVYSYFSHFNDESLKRIRYRYQIPGDVVLRIPNPDKQLPEEGEDYIRIRRTWGTPSSSVSLARPALSQVWRDRVLRAHHLSNRHYTNYIQPDLLFRHSFGPEPSAIVLTLIQANEKRLATMKINKNKLKNMVEKGAPVMMTGLKRKKVDEGQSSVPPEQSGLSLKKAHGLTVRRAKAVITEPFEEYANAQTENISKMIVHSLMRSLNEAMVISRRCLTLEDDLIRLKGRLAESEASQKNLNQAIFELGKEKKDAFEELERIKVDLATKDGDVKAVVDARDEAVKEMKHLMAFRKQAKERYLKLDFSVFQSYDNTISFNDVGRRKGGDGDQADDATS